MAGGGEWSEDYKKIQEAMFLDHKPNHHHESAELGKKDLCQMPDREAQRQDLRCLQNAET
jgi:hypothetical protein